jgi:hypothetical protein
MGEEDMAEMCTPFIMDTVSKWVSVVRSGYEGRGAPIACPDVLSPLIMHAYPPAGGL